MKSISLGIRQNLGLLQMFGFVLVPNPCPKGTKVPDLDPLPCVHHMSQNQTTRKATAQIYGWDCPLFSFTYPGVACAALHLWVQNRSIQLLAQVLLAAGRQTW